MKKREFDQIIKKFKDKINHNNDLENKLAQKNIDNFLKELNKKWKQTEEECRKSKEERDRNNPPELLLKRDIEKLYNRLHEGGFIFDFRQFRFCKEENEYEILEYLDGYCCAGLSHKITKDSFMKLFDWYIAHLEGFWNEDNKSLRDKYEQIVIDELKNKIKTVKVR